MWQKSKSSANILVNIIIWFSRPRNARKMILNFIWKLLLREHSVYNDITWFYELWIHCSTVTSSVVNGHNLLISIRSNGLAPLDFVLLCFFCFILFCFSVVLFFVLIFLFPFDRKHYFIDRKDYYKYLRGWKILFQQII